MTRSDFWKLIDSTRPKRADCEKHLSKLTAQLAKMEPEAIASFEKHVLDLHDEAYDASLLEVLWILTGGGPGDDGLSYFTSWLILQGQTVFEQILKEPQRLPELYPPDTSIYSNGLSGAALTAYEDEKGLGDFNAYYEQIYGSYQQPKAPRGAKKDPRLEREEVLEKRLRKKYPDLWQYEAQYD